MRTITAAPFARRPAALACLAIAVAAGTAHAQPRVRMNIKDQNAADQQRFVDAMFALQRMAPTGGVPPNNPDGTPSPLPRNKYEEYVRAHDRNSNLAHDNSVFLPWHRQFLFQMENDVRALGAVMVPDPAAPGGMRAQDFSGFTVPYWDGTRDAYPAILGGNGNGAPNFRVTTGAFASANGPWTAYNLTGAGTVASPFAATREPLRRQFGADADNDGRFDVLVNNGPAALTAALALDGVTAGQRYTNFRSAVEGPFDGTNNGLHNDHHFQVGGPNGQLGNPTSGTTDPTFWLLHAFTDLQWARWECLRGPLYQSAGGPDAAMTGAPDAGGAVFGLSELNTANIYGNAGNAVTPANVLNFLTMPGGGYTYDARLSYDNETRTVLGQGGNACAVPAPGALALLGAGGLLAARRRRA